MMHEKKKVIGFFAIFLLLGASLFLIQLVSFGGITGFYLLSDAEPLTYDFESTLQQFNYADGALSLRYEVWNTGNALEEFDVTITIRDEARRIARFKDSVSVAGGEIVLFDYTKELGLLAGNYEVFVDISNGAKVIRLQERFFVN